MKEKSYRDLEEEFDLALVAEENRLLPSDIEYINNPSEYLERIKTDAEQARLALVGLLTTAKRDSDKIAAAKELLKLASNTDGGLLGITKEDIGELGRRELSKLVKKWAKEIDNEEDKNVIDISDFSEE